MKPETVTTPFPGGDPNELPAPYVKIALAMQGDRQPNPTQEEQQQALDMAIWWWWQAPRLRPATVEQTPVLPWEACLDRTVEILMAAADRLGIDSQPVYMAAAAVKRGEVGATVDAGNATVEILRLRLANPQPADADREPWLEITPKELGRRWKRSADTVARRLKTMVAEGKAEKIHPKLYRVRRDELVE